jgi:hypothetical protein
LKMGPEELRKQDLAVHSQLQIERVSFNRQPPLIYLAGCDLPTAAGTTAPKTSTSKTAKTTATASTAKTTSTATKPSSANNRRKKYTSITPSTHHTSASSTTSAS